MAVMNTQNIFSTCALFWNGIDIFSLLQANKEFFETVSQSVPLKSSPFCELSAFAKFKESLLKIELNNRLHTWLDFEYELQEFREVHIIAPHKNFQIRFALENWLHSPESSYGVDSYPWPSDFDAQAMVSLVESCTILSSKSAHWACPLNQHDDSILNAGGNSVYEKELKVQSFEMTFWDTCNPERRQSQNSSNLSSLLDNGSGQPLLFFDFSDSLQSSEVTNIHVQNIKFLSKQLLPCVDSKIFLHLSLVFSVPFGVEIGRFYQHEDACRFNPQTIFELWEFINSNVWSPTLQQMELLRNIHF